MNMEKKLAQLFEKCGQEILLDTFSEKFTYRAFVQMMRYKNKMYIDLPQGEVGRRDNGCYLYIGPPEYDFTRIPTITKVTFGGFLYRVKRAEMIYLKGRPLYVWAVLYRVIKDGEYISEIA